MPGNGLARYLKYLLHSIMIEIMGKKIRGRIVCLPKSELSNYGNMIFLS